MSKEKRDRLENCSLRLRSELIAELRDISEQTDRSLANTMRRIIESSIGDYKRKEGIGIGKDDDEDSEKFILRLDSGKTASA